MRNLGLWNCDSAPVTYQGFRISSFRVSDVAHANEGAFLRRPSYNNQFPAAPTSRVHWIRVANVREQDRRCRVHSEIQAARDENQSECRVQGRIAVWKWLRNIIWNERKWSRAGNARWNTHRTEIIPQYKSILTGGAQLQPLHLHHPEEHEHRNDGDYVLSAQRAKLHGGRKGVREGVHGCEVRVYRWFTWWVPRKSNKNITRNFICSTHDDSLLNVTRFEHILEKTWLFQILPEQEWIRASGRSAEGVRCDDEASNEEVAIHDDHERSDWSIPVGIRGQVHSVSKNKQYLLTYSAKAGSESIAPKLYFFDFIDVTLSRIPHGAGYCNGCHRNMTCFILSEYDRIQAQLARGHLFRSFEDRHFFPQNWYGDKYKKKEQFAMISLMVIERNLIRRENCSHCYNCSEIITVNVNCSGAAICSRSMTTTASSGTPAIRPKRYSEISFPSSKSSECRRPRSNSFGISSTPVGQSTQRCSRKRVLSTSSDWEVHPSC